MHDRAGTAALPSDLIDIDELIRAYHDLHPDVEDPEQKVAFGTSGHRGSSLKAAFNEDHILAITQAIVEHRAEQGITGPLFIGRDTHGLSKPAEDTALEVLVANGVRVLADSRDSWCPTPALSHAILRWNRDDAHGDDDVADGIVVTPSHNPPADGGFKYNPPHGGPADSDATGWIAARANAIIAGGLVDVKRVPLEEARGRVEGHDFLGHYEDDLGSIIDMEAIRKAGVRIGADPLGGASDENWAAIGERHGLDLEV